MGGRHAAEHTDEISLAAIRAYRPPAPYVPPADPMFAGGPMFALIGVAAFLWFAVPVLKAVADWWL